MEVQWGEVVATGEVEGEGGRPFAVVAGLPHCMDLGDGEVDGLPGLGRSQGLEEGRGREGGRGEHICRASYNGQACGDTTTISTSTRIDSVDKSTAMPLSWTSTGTSNKHLLR